MWIVCVNRPNYPEVTTFKSFEDAETYYNELVSELDGLETYYNDESVYMSLVVRESHYKETPWR